MKGQTMTESLDSRCFFHMQRVQKREKEGTNFDLENVEKWRKRLLRSASCKIRQRGKLEAGLLFDSGSCFIAGITNVRPKFRAA